MSSAEDSHRVSTVHLGNICPSPIAEVVRASVVEDTDPSVPDPYGGGPEGFGTVYTQVGAACAGPVARLPEFLADR